MKRIGFFFGFTFLVLFSFAQGPTSNWYFGYAAGIRFENYDPFFVLDNGMDSVSEGCAAISKSNGELVYYGSPEYAFNRQHDTVHNGSGLAGNLTSTQGALFVPNPIDTNIVYYVNELPSHVYSIIRATQNFPNGEILSGEKNILLKDSSSEKTTAVHHANGKDIWIILRDYPEDTMLAFLVTENGINPNPVKSALPYGYWGIFGQLKSSPNGKFLAESTGSQYYWNNHYQAFLYKFDNATGVVSETLPISDTLLFSYGCEFSANSKYVYFSNYFGALFGGIFQYSLENFDSTSVQNSRYMHNVSAGASMQIGIDQRIYIVKNYNGYLDRIENPNEYGANLIHTDSAVYLGGRLSILGLPDFIQSYFRPAYFDYTSKCGFPVKFQAQNHLYNRAC